ncbi:exodeoxyribonuclease V subunit beta [Allofrancisella guangzhouensis]|uniref:exodeoxyribonuclease V subunit beta n=1 Tax=Allofrancisella guangzhouensis TaxID=594679 RepID=UPI00068EF514|nr:exodeoxyribonuclease V subunit beta [Allofrancisella guangzhouensis]MBK2026735.1 exodeoxyribonuclease V subunit beta [Allofrancisella guangzhouensis]MBK2043660.1 exodeoxyribonuclease V subunit beta [Allofrancisella guangzhouensis]MBK2046185.1 exodeoxyribonuclease V subunit beta [Allofrancisella guangzhouensis]
MQPLDIKKIPLVGRHIIEASAGTGKTYNITELYIRLLLEKSLLPKNILVMTFTKDATQEIIGRVESKIREKLTTYDTNFSEYKHLKKALLEIDEAAIFTIHGFCKKVLSEQAFSSGMDIDVSMEVDTSDLLLEATREYFRKYINSNAEKFSLLRSINWHTPERFINGSSQNSKGFKEVILSSNEIEVLSFEDVEKQLYKERLKVFEEVSIHSDFIFEKLVNNHNKKSEREQEWNTIKEWCLSYKLTSVPKELSTFVNGNRYRNLKEEFEPIFFNLKALRDKYNKEIKDSDAYKQVFKAYVLAKQICLDIREDFKKLKAKNAILDFDDLIIKLRDSLKNSQELALFLRKDYPVALIDEFQDTDNQQYEILDAIYPLENEEMFLVMIGDPKQAIYRFRGGDIYTYLRAKQSAKYIWTMDTNWRSTSQIVAAYNRLFYKSDILPESQDYKEDVFSQGIGYQITKSAKNLDDRNFNDNLAAINYFIYDPKSNDSEKNLTTEDLRLKLAKWTASEIVKLLKTQTVQEQDIAILVQNSNQAKLITENLKEFGLSSVYLSERSNIYATEEACQLFNLLKGLNNYQDQKLLKQALATAFFGKTIDDFLDYRNLDTGSKWQQAAQRARYLRQIWFTQGVMALIMELLHNDFAIRESNKERILTNILHLAELIKIAENRYKSKNQLINWLEKQIYNQNSSSQTELRLESDEKLIKVVTIHGSKGLEYSVVFVPFASDTKLEKSSPINKVSMLKKTYYQIGEDQLVTENIRLQELEEAMRLLYVAVTRAVNRCYLGVANFKNSQSSPLAKFLDYTEIDSWKDKIQKLTNNPNNYSELITFDKIDFIKYKSRNSSIELDKLVAKRFTKKVEKDWQLMSFSSITRPTHAQYEQPLDFKIDEVKEDDKNDNTSLELRFRAAKGADTGNLLHNILELSDFSKPLDERLIKEQMLIYKVIDESEFDHLKTWLNEIMQADIPDLYKSDSYFQLKNLSMEKTLREAEFYLPVTNVSLFKKDIYQILAEHRNTVDLGYGFQRLFGMLHGFIDLIFEHDGRFYIADYKSNYLGDKISNYNQEAMKVKNQQSMYDLQYLIYSVALHRFLRQNLEIYDFDKHFGGVYYFYLRGFKDGFGVYNTVLEKQTVLALDGLFGD